MSELILPYSGRRHCAPIQDAPALEAKNLSAIYSGYSKPAIEHINLTIQRGKEVALVGPNGSGKSTLFKVITGFLPIHSGSVKIYGNAIGLCHHRTVYLPQRHEIDWNFPFDVRKLALSGRYVHLGWLKNPTQKDCDIVDEALKRLGLAKLASRQISELSGGQQQRLLLARAFVQEPDLYLLDEPYNAVDTETRDLIKKFLSELKHKGKTLIVSTHFIDKIDTEYDSAIYLKDGRLVDGPLPEDHHRCGHDH